MTELDEIKADINDTQKELKDARIAGALSGDFSRRNTLECLLIEQLKKENFLYWLELVIIFH
jgi:hypothetical protein